jgi:hypothetical protein
MCDCLENSRKAIIKQLGAEWVRFRPEVESLDGSYEGKRFGMPFEYGEKGKTKKSFMTSVFCPLCGEAYE